MVKLTDIFGIHNWQTVLRKKPPQAGVYGKAMVICRTPAAQHYWETDDDKNMGYGNMVEIKSVNVGDYVFTQSGTFKKVLKVLKKRIPYAKWQSVFVDDPFPLEGLIEYNELERRYFKRKGFFLGYMTETQRALNGVVASFLWTTREIPHPFVRRIAATDIIRRFHGTPYGGKVSEIPKNAYHCPSEGGVFLYYDEDTVKMWARNDLVKKVNGSGAEVAAEEVAKNHAPNYVQLMTLKTISLDYNMMGDDTAYSLVTEDGTFVANGLYLQSAEE